MSKSIANYNHSQGTVLACTHRNIHLKRSQYEAYQQTIVNNHTGDEDIEGSTHSILSPTKTFSLEDYGFCFIVSNLPFIQVNVFQTLKLIARLIVLVHCTETKRVRELDDDFPRHPKD